MTSARDLAAAALEGYEVPFLGRLPVGERTVATVYGPPGSGKSTLLLQLGDALARDGARVLYASVEEGLSGTLREKLQRLEIRREGLVICGRVLVGDVLAYQRSHGLEWFLLDSYSASGWNVPDLTALESAGVSIAYTLHVTKDGMPGGAMALTHGADVVVSVEAGKWERTKHRFGESAGGGDLW